MANEERDLMPLDPARDPVRYERLVGAIMATAEPELKRRTATNSPLLLLTDWLRPTIAASATVAALAASAILFIGGTATSGAAEPGVAEGIGLPTAIADWIYTGQPGALDDLLFAMEREAE